MFAQTREEVTMKRYILGLIVGLAVWFRSRPF